MKLGVLVLTILLSLSSYSATLVSPTCRLWVTIENNHDEMPKNWQESLRKNLQNSGIKDVIIPVQDSDYNEYQKGDLVLSMGDYDCRYNYFFGFDKCSGEIVINRVVRQAGWFIMRGEDDRRVLMKHFELKKIWGKRGKKKGGRVDLSDLALSLLKKNQLKCVSETI